MESNEFTNYKLKELCSLITDGSHYSPSASSSGYPMFSVKDMREFDFDRTNCKLISNEDYEKMKKSGCVPQKGDVLVAKDGSYLKEIFICKETREEAILSSIALFRPDVDKCDSNYLCYVLKSPQVYNYIKNNCVSGSALPRIILKAFKEVYIPVPPLDTQRKIASILSAIDDKIELNNRMNENLENIIQTIYKEWFIDFNQWNGVMPKEWSIGSIVSNPFSTVIKPGVDVFDEKTYYATADINGLSLSEGKTINYHSRETRANMQPTNNSVWFAKMKNSIKHLILNDNCNNFINNSILSTGFCGIQCTPESFEYIATYVRNPSFEIEKDHRAHGTTQEAVNLDDLNKIEMIIPTDDVLKEFHNQTNHLYLNITKNQIENKRLAELRDTLLPKLMSGEIDVDKVEL